MSNEELLSRLTEAVSEGDIETTNEVTKTIIDDDINALEAIQKKAAQGLDILGERFRRLEAYLPDLIRGGRQ